MIKHLKSRKKYDQPYELSAETILQAMKRDKNARKKPTSVALDESTIIELKKVASKQGIPYQVLIRVFIIDGLSRF